MFPRRQALFWELPAFSTSGEWFAGFLFSNQERGSSSRQEGWHRGQPSGPERRRAQRRKPGPFCPFLEHAGLFLLGALCLLLAPGTLFRCPRQDWPLLIL